MTLSKLEGAKAEEARSERTAVFTELRIVIAVLTLVFLVMVGVMSRRFVWYDELFTFDIAKAPTAHDVLYLVYRWEPNPPASYFLSRWSMALFGQNAFGLRFPSMVEFYAGSMLLFAFVRRRVGIAYAALALLILWWSDTFRFATEARPYALILLCFAALLVSWGAATPPHDDGPGIQGPGTQNLRTRRLALGVVAVSSLGLVAAHVFAPLTLGAFMTAETVRSLRQRKVDWPVWCALLLPLLAGVYYLPLLRRYHSIMLPFAVQASWSRVAIFFADTFGGLWLVVGLAGLAALMVAALTRVDPDERNRQTAFNTRLGLDEYIAFAFLFLSPVILNLVLMHFESAYRNRYNITAQAAIYLALAVVMAMLLQKNQRAGYAACLVIVMFIAMYRVVPLIHAAPPGNVISFAALRPDLPLVSDSNVTFLEMNHYESPGVLSRLYYLKNRAAAIKYVHGTEAEDYTPPDQLGATFSIHAHVNPYVDFVAAHRQFLVFTAHDNPEGWLLPKLRDDRARLVSMGEYAAPGSYRDSTLYVVTMPPAFGK